MLLLGTWNSHTLRLKLVKEKISKISSVTSFAVIDNGGISSTFNRLLCSELSILIVVVVVVVFVNESFIMLMTGLVSLNVHEALTFEGTEICLHPDIFNNSGDGASYNAPTVSGSARHSVMSVGKDARINSAQAASSEDKPSSQVGPISPQGKTLRVGDMIEVRVWDPLPRSQQLASSNPSSVLLQRPASLAQSSTSGSQAEEPVSSGAEEALEVAALAVAAALKSTPEFTVPQLEETSPPQFEETTSRDMDTLTVSSEEQPSVQYQDAMTPLQSPGAFSSGDDNRTVVTSGVLPPVFPRSRASTADGAIGKARSNIADGAIGGNAFRMPSATKPPISQRRDTNKLRQSSTTPVTKSRHQRDLSDMTVDTFYGMDSTKAVAENNQHMDILPLATFDDEDDVWMHIENTHNMRLSFVMKVSEKSLNSLKSSARTQVSLLRQVADLYKLSSYDMVTIHRIEKGEEATVLRAVSADFVLVSIKDQFISRGDMHYFQQTLIGSWVYEGQRLSEPARGVQANAWEIRHGDHQARSGIVTEDTMFAFRSRSARIFWLVQMSAEMWDYSSPYERDQDECLCEIYFEKWIAFVHDLFAKWKELEATHSLTVVFFSRTFLGSASGLHGSPESSLDQRDVHGRRYEDHCKIVIERETAADWDSLVVRIKEAFLNYPREVGWKLSTGDAMRRPSAASQGNVLEAINVTLNLLQFHYLDRDLHRTGNSVVVVSAGNGVFEVDKALASITYQRMMDNGIGSDMLSLGLPPLHIAPFFLYVNDKQSVETDGVDAAGTYYEVPHWMHLSFVSYASNDTFPGERDGNDTKGNSEVSTAFEVAPNGFLLPANNGRNSAATGNASPALRPRPSFSLKGNVAASPFKIPKNLTQERQLISGRDFQDILEACRPRHGGLLPSALKALLKLYTEAEREDPSDDGYGERSGHPQPALDEWGALNFEDTSDSPIHLGRRSLTIAQDAGGGERASPLPGPVAFVSSSSQTTGPLLIISPPPGDELERFSPSGSYASSSVLGMSYDRPFLAEQVSPTLTGIQLQRAPSLEIDPLSDDGSETDGSSVLEAVWDTQGDSSVEESAYKSDDKFVASLRKTMRAHDSGRFVEPKINAGSDMTRSNHDEISQVRLVSGSTITTRAPPSSNIGYHQLLSPERPGMSVGGVSGGIGAALTQYTRTSNVRTTSDGSIVNIGGELDTARMKRGNSMLPISTHRRVQIPNMASRGLSPLLLPPVYVPGDGQGTRLGSLDRRFVHPREFTKQGQTEALGHRLQQDSKQALFAAGRTELQPDEKSPRKSLASEKGISMSPPKPGLGFAGSLKRSEALGQHRIAGRDQGHTRTQGSRAHNSRRKKAFNPFRQQDEDEVLAKKSHNRRRWSHVFPLGEVEFKRHAGPNWKSLSSPAILPLSVDYFPPQQEIDHSYTFSISNVTLSEFEKTHYSSNKDLLMEMVRQRKSLRALSCSLLGILSFLTLFDLLLSTGLTQDYQLVPPSHVNASNYRRESLRDGLANGGRATSVRDENLESNRQFLSMGHRLQVLTYDPVADIVEVTRYNAKNAQQNSGSNSFKYYYLGFCQETQKYTKVVQTFNKYAEQYNWSKVDRIICGDDDKEMREGMRSRRIMFALIPARFENMEGEQEYIAKFQRLLEYLNKLRGKDEASAGELDIKIVSSGDKDGKGLESLSTPGISRSNMNRFYVQLRKGKHDLYEWMEVVLDSTFDTSWSYRIIFNWLVASSGKVDAQVQLLQRRCSQYGLNLVPYPQTTLSKSMYLNPFKAPALFVVRDKNRAALIGAALLAKDFVHDGVFSTDAMPVTECIDNGKEFDFGNRWSIPALGRQYVHRSGTLFVRQLIDRKGWSILVAFGNYRYITREETSRESAQDAFKDLKQCVASLEETDANLPETTSAGPAQETMQPGNIE